MKSLFCQTKPQPRFVVGNFAVFASCRQASLLTTWAAGGETRGQYQKSFPMFNTGQLISVEVTKCKKATKLNSTLVQLNMTEKTFAIDLADPTSKRETHTDRQTERERERERNLCSLNHSTQLSHFRFPSRKKSFHCPQEAVCFNGAAEPENGEGQHPSNQNRHLLDSGSRRRATQIHGPARPEMVQILGHRGLARGRMWPGSNNFCVVQIRIERVDERVKGW